MNETSTIKCLCTHCGAKYRLPVEAQGRKARCKKCGDHFEVPKADSMEDSILSWLSEPEVDEVVDQPRVISMKSEQQADAETMKKVKGVVRMKADSGLDSSKSGQL